MRSITLIFLLLIVSACSIKRDPLIQSPENIDPSSIVVTTPTLIPLPTFIPSPTPLDLKGLFCEYQFCIGHPTDMAFFDVSAQKNPASPSTYSQGLIAAFNGNLFIQVVWQLSPGTTDPQFVLDLILDDVDTRAGNLDVKLIRDMNVLYTPITSTATPVLPFGAAGAWVCGERGFAWKVYTPQAESTQALFDAALDRFACNR